MRAVNLLPRDEQRQRLSNARVPLFVAVGGVVAVTALSMFLASSATGEAEAGRTELQAVEAAIRALPRSEQQAVTQGTLVRERSDRVAALAAALDTRVPFDRVLREISYVLPEDTWLTQLTATAPERVGLVPAGSAPPPTSTTTAAGVTIEGATYSHDAVARFLARLGIVPSLENVELTSSARVDPQTESPSAQGPGMPRAPQKPQKPFVTFIISASLKTGATQ